MTNMTNVKHLGGFQTIEFRRYTMKEDKREQFARYFESFFPEAFQQLGAIAFGQFFEREKPDGFTWIRGFRNMDARATINAAFYYGPLWKEHSATMNELMIDSDNVLLLTPLSPEQAVAILPAVDPVNEVKGAEGVIVAQIFPVKAGDVEPFALEAVETFASYRIAGVHEAGILISLDVPNNFPQLPFRTDGPHLVWLGIVKDDQIMERQFRPLVESCLHPLSAKGFLRGAPELLVLDPTPRSRLRWLPEWQQ